MLITVIYFPHGNVVKLKFVQTLDFKCFGVQLFAQFGLACVLNQYLDAV